MNGSEGWNATQQRPETPGRQKRLGSLGVVRRVLRSRVMRRRKGITFLEVMMVVTIVALLAALAVNEAFVSVMYARRSNAIVGLSHVWEAQKAYAAENGEFAANFSDLVMDLEGSEIIDPVTMKAGPYTYQLSRPWGATSFYCIATAQLDADPYPDVVEVFEVTTEGI